MKSEQSNSIGLKTSKKEALYKIVCFGDSTTDASYVNIDEDYALAYKDLKVYSKWLEEELDQVLSKKVEIINSGVSGDTTLDAKLRFKRDVLDYSPDMVIIQFGANDQSIRQDIGLTKPIISIEDFAYNILFFISRIKKMTPNIILMTPGLILWKDHFKSKFFKSPYAINSRLGLSNNLSNYAEIIRKIALEEQVGLIDIFNEEIKFDKTSDNALDAFLPDGLHPNTEGHKFIANLIIEHIKKQST